MHFDPTISIGNVITMTLAAAAIIFAWRDMDWRVKNLEIWRREQLEGIKARVIVDERFQTAVEDFKLAIAQLSVKVAMMDKHPR